MDRKNPNYIRPLLSLFILPALIAEVLTGNVLPLYIFSWQFLFMILLYGCGAMAVREAALKWGKGIGTILVLAAAYGVVEEGLAVKTFFDTQNTQVGDLVWYGRWLGVNWVWVFGITVFHAIFSITIPIILVDLAFPEIRGKRLLPDVGLYICTAVVVLLTGITAFFVSIYKPHVFLYILTILLVLSLIFLGRFLPNKVIRIKPGPPRLSHWKIGVGAVLLSILLMVSMYGPTMLSLPILSILASAVSCFLIFGFAKRYFGQTDNELHKLAFVSGLLFIYILVAILKDIFESFTGVSVVGVFVIFLLLAIARNIKKRQGVIVAIGQ